MAEIPHTKINRKYIDLANTLYDTEKFLISILLRSFENRSVE